MVCNNNKLFILFLLTSSSFVNGSFGEGFIDLNIDERELEVMANLDNALDKAHSTEEIISLVFDPLLKANPLIKDKLPTTISENKIRTISAIKKYIDPLVQKYQELIGSATVGESETLQDVQRFKLLVFNLGKLFRELDEQLRALSVSYIHPDKIVDTEKVLEKIRIWFTYLIRMHKIMNAAIRTVIGRQKVAIEETSLSEQTEKMSFKIAFALVKLKYAVLSLIKRKQAQDNRLQAPAIYSEVMVLKQSSESLLAEMSFLSQRIEDSYIQFQKNNSVGFMLLEDEKLDALENILKDPFATQDTGL